MKSISNIYKIKTLTIIGIGFIILLLIPLIIYIIHFAHNGISDDPVFWGSLGDYINGLVAPIISIASLFVLIGLTIIMAKQGNEESKKLFILQQKMSAFQELSANLKGFYSLKTKLLAVNSYISMSQNGRIYEDQLKDIIEKNFDPLESFKEYFDFYYSFELFETKYSYLFKYDFKSKEHKYLKAQTHINYGYENRMADLFSGWEVTTLY